MSKSTTSLPFPPARGVAVQRGVAGRCPVCGVGPLFAGFARVHPVCPHCSAEHTRHPVDDGPAYFTMFLALAMLVPGLVVVELKWEPAPWVHLLLGLGLTLAIVGLVLPRLKGVFLGIAWSLDSDGPPPSAPST